MPALTANSFRSLLERLGEGDFAAGAEKYELLRMKLIRSFHWRGCPESHSDALVDTVLDRIAAKLESGVEVLNINSYSAEVLRLVWLEHTRKHREDALGDSSMPEGSSNPDEAPFEDSDLRLRCLRKCLAEIASDDSMRRLIIGYYDPDAGDKVKDARKRLAESMGLSMGNLRVRACRLRERLERCINLCVARLTVTETSRSDTRLEGGKSR